jgi:aryl-alcohol dehydrogenase-like predicted oxidoreductase
MILDRPVGTALHGRETMKGTSLRARQLGATRLEMTAVGIGAWAVGSGGWDFGWGPQHEEESIAAIQHALALGVNWIDTAAAYGFGRHGRVVHNLKCAR